MSPLFSQSRAHELLASHLPGFGMCLYGAVDRFNTVRPVLGLVSARSQASIISDYAIDQAAVVFADAPDVSVIRCQGDLPVLNCGGLVCVRFKKLAAGWSFSRNDTDQTKRWESQAPLVGMEAAVNLAAAYRLDETGRELELVALVYSLNRRYQWHIEIPSPGQVVQMPETLLDDSQVAATVRSDLPATKRDTDGV